MPRPRFSRRRNTSRLDPRRLRAASARNSRAAPAPNPADHPSAIDATVAQRLRNLAPQDLELRFQPILLLREPGRCALELLVRFRPPELAALGTGEVVRCAEALDLVHRLDRLVLGRLHEVRQAWGELAALQDRLAYISVNISSGSVATVQREDALIALMRELRIDPGLFRFELSETAAMEERPGPGGVRSVSQRLIEELEIRLLIDDFGSGLCNYRRLCEAWYDTIKLDLQLVRGIAGSFRMQTFVGSLIQAVHGLGRSVVAEGVEDRRDLEVLLRLGVDAVQGFLVAMPLTWQEVAPFLAESAWLAADCLSGIQAGIRESDARIRAPLLSEPSAVDTGAVPLERYVLHHWSSLRNFEEVLLCYLRELQSWNLEVLRLSFAFLPHQEEVDCSQFIWHVNRPGEVQSMRMQRDFLQTAQHLGSVLHHIATREPVYRQRLAEVERSGFDFLEELRQQGGCDYLGLRLASRGVSTPVLSICLRGGRFSDAQVERIEALSNLLSLLFHAFECERASRLALLDALTDLPNRRSFDSRIRAEAVAAATRGTPLALVLIDIDRFKLVNDSLGHAYGDTCLNRVAAVLSSQLRRGGSMVARLGGEEFGVVLTDTSAADAAAIAERLRRSVAEAEIGHPAPVNGIGLTISLGLASWTPGPAASLDLDALLQRADDCLYAAKREGRDRVVCGVIAAD